MTLSHEELGRNWGDQDLTHPVSKWFLLAYRPYQGVHCAWFNLSISLLCPFRPCKGRIFHALSLFQAALATAFVSECFFHLLSCSVIIFAAWPGHAQPPAVNGGHTQPPVVLLIWYTRLHAHVLPHPACFLSFAVKYPLTGTIRSKRTGWDQAKCVSVHSFPCLQSSLSLLLIPCSSSGAFSVSLKIVAEYSWKFCFGSSKSICFEKLSM